MEATACAPTYPLQAYDNDDLNNCDTELYSRQQVRRGQQPTPRSPTTPPLGEVVMSLVPQPLRQSTRTRRTPAVFNATTVESQAAGRGKGRGRTLTPSAAAVAVSQDNEGGEITNRRAHRQRGRVCKTDGCDNYIVHNGLCCRHGGGKRCSVDGCGACAKHRGLCWRHGGSTKCKVDRCVKKAKAKGVCWAHGGGPPCSHVDCTKIAVSGGACWAHGGGKRCIHDGCQRPAYARTHNFCEKHFQELQDIDYYEV